MHKWAVGLIALPLVAASPALADDFSEGSGWHQIYLEDFAGQIFATGVSKHRVCVERAYEKAHEVKQKGGSYVPIIALDEAIQIAAKTWDEKQLAIVCSPNGALAIYYKAPQSLESVYQSAATLGTPQKAGSPDVIRTDTTIDLRSGKATSTTTMPPP